ncbi:uncharacterized protein LOC118481259 isoform X1 [Helianthus annuus]|uniref:uncharacterized protein LOC118481259 isoform X1 n=1 Tax=Helianthus annuus TaxID=4232 RepID=UPI0016530791|nr:uncharacterized protein LOC118481259 isoform X1 [Helianthus annuus]
MTMMIKLMTVLGIDEGDGDVNGSERRTADSGSAVHGGGGGGTYFRQNLTVAIVVVLLNRLEFWSRVSTRVSHGRMSSGQQGVLTVRVSSSMFGSTRSTGQPGSNPVKPVNSSQLVSHGSGQVVSVSEYAVWFSSSGSVSGPGQNKVNRLSNTVKFGQLQSTQDAGIRDLARYAMSTRCVGDMRSSNFRGCGSCLDEWQVLSCVCFMFVVVSFEQDFILLCCIFVACVDV